MRTICFGNPMCGLNHEHKFTLNGESCCNEGITTFVKWGAKSGRTSPSAFVRLPFVSCSWQYSRREILRAKSPGPASIVKVEAAGDGGTTLTGADGTYTDDAFRAKTSPNFQLVFSPAGLTAIPMPTDSRPNGLFGFFRTLQGCPRLHF